MSIINNRVTLFIFQWIIGLVFIYASLHKIVETQGFAQDIQNYRLLPYSMTHIAAMILPWLEFLAGLFLIINTMVRESTLISAFLLAIFIMALVSALLRGLNIDCGCFTLAGDLQYADAYAARLGMVTAIGRNVLLFAMSLAVLLFSPERPCN